SNMREAHRKITPVIPSSVIFDIPEWYQQTFSSERFLLVDFFMTHGKDRVLVCSSDQHLELLFESETIFMDGAFDTTPTNFKQAYLYFSIILRHEPYSPMNNYITTSSLLKVSKNYLFNF
ncbi:unnamed protein product, partial [Rotaria magnacalcarata]